MKQEKQTQNAAVRKAYPSDLRAAGEAIPRYEAVGEVDDLVQTLHLASMAHIYAGDFVSGHRYIQRAATIVERTGDPSDPIFIGSVRAHVAFFRGQWDEARRLAEWSVEHGRKLDPSHGLVLRTVIYPLIELGRMRLVEGAIGSARDALTEAIAAVECQHDIPALPWAHSLCAECDLAEGNAVATRGRLRPVIASFALVEWAEADDLLTRGLACAYERGERLTLADLLRVQALLRVRQGRWQEAVDALEESLALTCAMSYSYAEAKALYVYGQYQAALAIYDQLGERLYPPPHRADADTPRTGNSMRSSVRRFHTLSLESRASRNAPASHWEPTSERGDRDEFTKQANHGLKGCKHGPPWRALHRRSQRHPRKTRRACRGLADLGAEAANSAWVRLFGD